MPCVSLVLAMLLVASLGTVALLALSSQGRLQFAWPSGSGMLHLMVDHGQIEFGSERDVSMMPEYVQDLRAGRLFTPYRLVGTGHWDFLGASLSWASFDGTEPWFGIIAPAVIAVPVTLLSVIVLVLGLRRGRRRQPAPTNPVNDPPWTAVSD